MHNSENVINSDINLIGGIPDYRLIIDIIKEYTNYITEEYNTNIMFSKSSYSRINTHSHEDIIEDNIYNLRTIKSRKRFVSAALSAFTRFRSVNHGILIRDLFRLPNLENLKNNVLFFQFTINNYLFYLLTKNVFIKLYFSGRFSLPHKDVESYLFHLRESDETLREWSESTIKIVASKYLTVLRKLGYLKSDKSEEFIHFNPDEKTFIFFIYLIKSVEPSLNDIFKSKYIDFILMSKEAIIEYAKKLSLKSFINISTSGTDMNIELKYQFNEIINAIT